MVYRRQKLVLNYWRIRQNINCKDIALILLATNKDFFKFNKWPSQSYKMDEASHYIDPDSPDSPKVLLPHKLLWLYCFASSKELKQFALDECKFSTSNFNNLKTAWVIVRCMKGGKKREEKINKRLYNCISYLPVLKLSIENLVIRTQPTLTRLARISHIEQFVIFKSTIIIIIITELWQVSLIWLSRETGNNN